MLEHAREITLAGHRLVVSSFHYPQYLPGVSSLCSQLLTLFAADAALLVVRMGEKTLLFGRAHQNFDVAAAFAEAFGGGGHPGAAFAKADLDPDAALETALETMRRHAIPVLTAAVLMSHPVKTIHDNATVVEAQRLLIHYGHNGVPVVSNEGKLVGILSRRDLERALRHGLGRSSVTGFMTRDVITADEGFTLTELESLVMKNNVGRIPIMRGDELVGIVTRTDLIAARHETRVTQIPSEQVLSRLPTMVLEVLTEAAEWAPDTAIYLVGGTVRDALLGTGLQDLDLVLEAGDAQQLGHNLKSTFGGRLNCHQGFGTCTLVLPSGLVIDLATAREEYYRHPGALPTVTPSTLRKDLSRRDFTVNALALRFHPEPATMLDPYGGLADMEAKELKLLHPLSFIEDPTRILRGARLAGRLGFRFDDITLQRAKAALIPEVLGKISRERLRSELELCCQEPRPGPALFYLEEIGALEAMFGLTVDRQLLLTLDELAQQLALPRESCLLALLLRLDDDKVDTHFEAFRWPKRYLQARGRLLDIERRQLVRDEDLERLGEAGRAVVKAFSQELKARVTAFEKVPRRRKLRGQDVLDLGLASGPEVGKVLEEVARARAAEQVHTFEEELDLARNLVAELPAPLHSEE
jgi:tRNA nucleotidyltransferase (CCA-adding enzyme)